MSFNGVPEIYGIDPFDSGSVQLHQLGTKGVLPDGSTYRYVKAGATALVAGNLYDGPAGVANHTNLTCAAAAAAATTITVTLGATAATANQYQDGYIVINDVDGQGFTYRIKSHPAADASATLELTLQPNTPVVTALTTSSQASLVANQYNGVIIHATTETGIPVGVCDYRQIAASEFGWIKTRGTAGLLIKATTGIGLSVAASDTTTAGAGEVGDGVLPPIGYALAAGVDTEYNPVFLTID